MSNTNLPFQDQAIDQYDVGVRRSDRQPILTDKGREYRRTLLLENLKTDRKTLLAFLADTDRRFQSESVDRQDMLDRRSQITAQLSALKELVQKVSELGVDDADIENVDAILNDVTEMAVSTMNKIIIATKPLDGALSRSLRSSSTSRSSTSARLVAAAEAAALRAKLEAQQLESEKQDKLEQMELEEKMRRLQAESKMAKIKRELEGGQIAVQLRMEEARLQVLEEASDCRSLSSTSTSKSALRTDQHPVLSGLHTDAPVFFPRVETINEQLADVLARAMSAGRLPIPEPPIFTGDPMQYCDWLFSFTSLIENRGVPSAEKIHYLKRYLGGPAKEAVSGYFQLRSENAYQTARNILEQRFGNPFIIAEAFRTKLDAWPKVKDKVGLRSLSDFLLQCNTAADEIKDLNILNDVREIKKIATKLPDWIVHRWNRQIAVAKKTHGRYPTFHEFAQFIAEESEIVNDPVVASESSSAQMFTRHYNSGWKETRMTTHKIQGIDNFEPSGSCLFCKRQNHTLSECGDFMKEEMIDRKTFILKEGLCFGCLVPGHMSRQCTNRSKCKKCQKKHPTSLHTNQSITSVSEQLQEDKKTDEKGACRKTLSKPESSCNSLTSMAVPVYVSTENNPGREILVYALLDTMSDSTFIVDAVAQDLQASAEPAVLRLTTMTDDGVNVSCRRFSGLRVRGLNSNRTISLPVTYSRNHIPLEEEHIPSPETASKWPHLSRLENLLAPKQNCPVGLLIGYNCSRALAPLNCVIGEGSQPYAVETELGWSIVGGIAPSSERFDAIGGSHMVVTQDIPHSVCDPMRSVTYVYKTQIKEVTTTDLMKLLEQDFKEQGSDLKTISQEDTKFLKILGEGIHQRPDGYYEMPLPFRNGEPDLPNNRQVALHRTLALKKQFGRKPQYCQHYIAFMREILERGDAEKIPDSELDTPYQWYIPHHGVYHPQKPNKVRVVFDCSARYQGVCLNDHLLQGPDLINSLVGVLCRFREGPVAFTCDVEKMYHQFRVKRQHQDYLRFLWWENGDLSKPPVDYRMKVHLFGATSSPGCANFALKQLAKDHQHHGEKAAQFLINDFYVDDGLKGEQSVGAAADLLEKARRICLEGNLRLHKIVSNSTEVMNSVPESERGATLTSLDIDPRNTAIEKTLGLQWCTKSDCFCFELSIKDKPLTRRGILSTVASIYDPLGLISPVIFLGKTILQSACKDSLAWDCPISDNLRPQWEKWKMELQRLKELRIPRCYQPEGFGWPTSVQLHHFSDASLTGYGQCSYLRLENGVGQVHCTLVKAKARVAPLKATTVPRLELQAAVLSANTAKVLDAELNYPNITHYYWTDSKVVLGYIKNETARFHMYVANRVHQIRQTSPPQQWNYVSTSENPADHASRGLAVGQLSASNWFTGPAFLWKTEISMDNVDCEVSPHDVEVKSTTLLTTQEPQFTTFETRIRRFSTYKGAIAAVAVIIRCCTRRQGRQISDLEAMQVAERNLIHVIQREAFGGFRDLKSKSSPLRDLDPFRDGDGLLRVGGRLQKTSELYGVKHPVILPKASHLSLLLALHHHKRTAHQGRNLTINEVRSRGYWIIGCRKVVSSVLNTCVTCSKHRGKSAGQRMADLPRERGEPSPPFTYCGIDCFGPFTAKEGRKEMKRYGLIFTCLAMRAIHIEVLDDMTTDSFLNGLRCFIALRGKVRMIRCDQGSNFVGAKHELRENFSRVDYGTITSRLLDLQCEFKFNPPSSSHMGGVWERQIRTVRSVLTGILDQSSFRPLNTSSLRTLMYEVMAIVNSRPLTTENLERADGPLPLTPNHLLTMKSGIIMPPPPGKFEREDLYLRRRWRQVQFLADMFWTRWKREYLQSLQARNTWQQPKDNVCTGDVVLLQEDGICRADWKIARVEETFPSDDGLVRKVKLLMATSELDRHGKPMQQRTYLERPVHKLIILLRSEDSTAE